jgi:hypothetical protein
MLTDNKCLMVCLVSIIVLILLFSINKKREHYFPIPKYSDVYQWKNIKATEWSPYWYFDSEYKQPLFASKWNPLWDSDNIYHPIVPQITHYKPNSNKLPNNNNIYDINNPHNNPI